MTPRESLPIDFITSNDPFCHIDLDSLAEIALLRQQVQEAAQSDTTQDSSEAPPSEQGE